MKNFFFIIFTSFNLIYILFSVISSSKINILRYFENCAVKSGHLKKFRIEKIQNLFPNPGVLDTFVLKNKKIQKNNIKFDFMGSKISKNSNKHKKLE